MNAGGRLCALPILVLGLVAGGPGRAVDAAEPVIELPKYEVAETRLLPLPESWRHGRMPGFEVLSNASDDATQKLLREFQLFRAALGVVWPALEARPTGPMALILCARGGKFDAFVPTEGKFSAASVLLGDARRASIVLDLESTRFNLDPARAAGDGAFSLGSLREVDHPKELYHAYVRHLLAQTEPRAPAWLEEGMAQLVMGMKFDRKRIEFAKLENPNALTIAQTTALERMAAERQGPAGEGDFRPPPGSVSRDLLLELQNRTTGGTAEHVVVGEDRDFNAALAGIRLMPLAEMFAVTHDSPVARRAGGTSWSKQCCAFVHLCLYGERKRYQKGFAQFIVRLAKEPLSEALFKECLGMSYRSMAVTLRGYIQWTTYEPLEWSAVKGGGFPEPAAVELREATEAEVGRIKGETLALAGHAGRAWAELLAPYQRGQRDPELLAAMGLHEYTQDRLPGATALLEAALAAKAARPEAWLALAKLRQAEALAHPAGPDGRLDAAQTERVLALVRRARLQPPAVGRYELAAATWQRSAAKPTKDDLALLVEGVRLFPGKLRLVHQTAELCAAAGILDAAHSLADHGIKLAPDAATKARFETLKRGLPPEPAPATRR